MNLFINLSVCLCFLNKTLFSKWIHYHIPPKKKIFKLKMYIESVKKFMLFVWYVPDLQGWFK